MDSQTIFRLGEVRARTGLSRSTIYAAVADGSFPRPIKLGERAVGWLSSELDVWLQEKIDARDAGEKP